MYKYRLEMVDEYNVNCLSRIYRLYDSVMESHYVSENLLQKMREEVDNMASILAGEQGPYDIFFSNINQLNEKMYEQMEYIHRTGRPEMGMDWETYEIDQLNTEYKLKYEILMDDLENCELFKL